MIALRETYLSLWRGAVPVPPAETYLSLWLGAIPIPEYGGPRRLTTWRDDAREIAAKHDISANELLGDSPAYAFAHPRQELMWRMRERGFSWGRIGELLDRDHTTIIKGVRAHERRMTAA